MRDWTDDERAQAKAAIVAGLSEGTPLRQLCRENDALPRARTVSDWRRADPEFDIAFLAARDEGYDAIAERTRDTARGKGDSQGDVQRDKLIIETDLKLLAKWDPRRYGERTTLAGDPGAPLLFKTIEMVVVDPKPTE